MRLTNSHKFRANSTPSSPREKQNTKLLRKTIPIYPKNQKEPKYLELEATPKTLSPRTPNTPSRGQTTRTLDPFPTPNHQPNHRPPTSAQNTQKKTTTTCVRYDTSMTLSDPLEILQLFANTIWFQFVNMRNTTSPKKIQSRLTHHRQYILTKNPQIRQSGPS